MHTTLLHYNRIIDNNLKLLPNLANRLKFLCTNYEVFLSTRSKIHEINQTLYPQLKTTKTKKFNSLANLPNTSESDENKEHNNIVTTLPEDLLLTEDERSVLNKGLKFVPVRKNVDQFQVMHDTELFLRCLPLKAHFHDPEEQPSQEIINISSPCEAAYIDNLFPTNSTWSPSTGAHNALDLYIEKCRYEISRILTSTTHTASLIFKDPSGWLYNNSNPEMMSLNLMTKVAKKDLQEGHSQLNSTSYKALSTNQTKSLNKTIIVVIKEEIRRENPPPNATKLYSQHPRTSVFICCLKFIE
eukprot:gene944-258_t